MPDQLAAAVLRQRPERLRAPADRADETLVTVVSFDCGQDRYGLPAAHCWEVQQLARTPWTPLAPAIHGVSALLNLRGRLCPVLDLLLLNPGRTGHPAHDRTAQAEAHVLLFGRAGQAWATAALLVDGLPRLELWPPDALLAPPELLHQSNHLPLDRIAPGGTAVLDPERLLRGLAGMSAQRERETSP
jgi:chemotaxis signal transduction protein